MSSKKFTFDKNFPWRLKYFINEVIGSNQTEFANQVGISDSYLSQIIQGKKKPGKDLILHLSLHYGEYFDWVVHGQAGMEGLGQIMPFISPNIDVDKKNFTEIKNIKSEYNLHKKANISFLEFSKKIDPIIKKAYNILKSDTIYSEALISNINAFYQALISDLLADKTRNTLEERIKNLEKRLNELEINDEDDRQSCKSFCNKYCKNCIWRKII